MPAAIIGKNQTMFTVFQNQDGTPFVVSKPVMFKIYSYNDLFIVEGSALQSITQPDEWYASFAIPEGSPIPNDYVNEQYRIEWYAENTDSPVPISMKALEYFQVLDTAEPLSYDSALALLIGQPLRDNLLTVLPIEEYEISIRNAEDNQIYFQKVTEPNSVLRNNCYVTSFDSVDAIYGATDRAMGICPYLIIYNYKTEQGWETEVHTLYIASAKAMIIANNMRRYMDKARNHDIDPSLRWTDVELIHFVVCGLNHFNVYAPSITNYTIGNFPQEFIYLIEKCAELEALNALYLAEGMRSFDFSGASVTLNVDRTEYIKVKMDEINSWLDKNLQKSKMLLIRRSNGSITVGVGLSSVTNGFSRYLNNYTLNRLLARRY